VGEISDIECLARVARKICESGTRCYPLNFYPQRVIHRCIPNSKNNIVESPTMLSMQCNSNRYKNETKINVD